MRRLYHNQGQSPSGFCSVKLRGAHATDCRFTSDEHPLLFVPKMGYVPVSGPRDFIHGGVPLLWPWFGSSGAPQLGAWRRWLNKVGFSLETQGPFHATARLSLFSVKAVTATVDETAIELTLGPCAEVSAYTPGDFALSYRISLGAHRLGLRLTTTNLGDTTFRYREGYHPYFAVSDCYKLTLAGVDGCRYESDRDLPCDVTHVWQGACPRMARLRPLPLRAGAERPHPHRPGLEARDRPFDDRRTRHRDLVPGRQGREQGDDEHPPRGVPRLFLHRAVQLLQRIGNRPRKRRVPHIRDRHLRPSHQVTDGPGLRPGERRSCPPISHYCWLVDSPLNKCYNHLRKTSQGE